MVGVIEVLSRVMVRVRVLPGVMVMGLPNVRLGGFLGLGYGRER